MADEIDTDSNSIVNGKPDEPGQCPYARIGHSDKIYCTLRSELTGGHYKLKPCNLKCRGANGI